MNEPSVFQEAIMSVGWGRKIYPGDHRLASQVMTNRDYKGLIFLSQIIDSFSCSPFNFAFLLLKRASRIT